MPSVHERVVAAVSSVDLPIMADQYTGSELRHMAYNIQTIPVLDGDDRPQYERYLISLHLYAPQGEDTRALIKSIKKLLYASGFTWPSMSSADDEDGQHKVFEFEDAEYIDYGEDDD